MLNFWGNENKNSQWGESNPLVVCLHYVRGNFAVQSCINTWHKRLETTGNHKAFYKNTDNFAKMKIDTTRRF